MADDLDMEFHLGRKPIYAQTFLETTVKAFAQYLSEGVFDDIDYMLDQKLSNLVLQELCDNHIIDFIIHQQIEQKFSSSMVFLPSFLRTDHGLLSLSQNFINFSIGPSVSYKEYADNEFKRNPNDPVNELRRNLVDVLSEGLNETTRNQLQTLSVHGFDYRYTGGWVLTLATLLPEITSLSLPCCALTANEFKVLCKKFKNLYNLDISESGLESLKGIYRLEKLESLTLAGLEFQTKEDIEDVFELKKLKKLDISGMGDARKPLSPNFQNYLRTGKSLPNLELLDISYNKFYEKDLMKLTRSHSLLQLVSIVGNNPKPAMFQMAPGSGTGIMCDVYIDLETICKTLQYYSSMSSTRVPTMYLLLRRFHAYVDSSYDNFDRKLLDKCYRLLVDIIGKHHGSTYVTMAALVALESMCINYRSGNIPSNLITPLLDAICKVLGIYVGDSPPVISKIMSMSWSILSSDGVLDEISRWRLHYLSVSAARAIALYPSCLPLSLTHVCSKLCGKVSDNIKNRFGKWRALKINVYKIMGMTTDSTLFMEIFEVFRIVFSKTLESWTRYGKIIWALLMKAYSFSQDPRIQTKIVEGLEEILFWDKDSKTRRCRRIFGIQEFHILSIFLASNDQDLVTATLSLIVEAWHFKIPWNIFRPQGVIETQEEFEEAKEQFIEYVYQSIRRSPKMTFKKFLKVKSDMNAHEPIDMIYWAKWVLKEHEKAVKKEKKCPNKYSKMMSTVEQRSNFYSCRTLEVLRHP